MAGEDALLGSLSERGAVFARMATPTFVNDKRAVSDVYDWRSNSNGLVNFGLAENALLREEVVAYLNNLRPFAGSDLAYPDRLTTSQRLKDAIAHLYNTQPDGYLDRSDWAERKPLEPVRPGHIHVSSGAGNVLNCLAWSLLEEGDGVLVGIPFYNGFVRDWTWKTGVKLVQVDLPMPAAGEPLGGGSWQSPDTVELYERALQQAHQSGVKVKVLLFCNPSNPHGQILPRETTIALLKFAAKHGLHFVSDEIYARTVFESCDDGSSSAPQFHSVLSISVRKEAGLDPAFVHVVSSSSKDFDSNGFRQGFLISQHNQALLATMDIQNLHSLTSQPAATLWTHWIRDTAFLEWFLAENRRRCALAYRYAAEWCKHHGIPYVPASAGHFFLMDFRRFLETSTIPNGRDAELALSNKLITHKVFIASGARYEHTVPGWFRFVFTLEAHALREGLTRVEQGLELEPWAHQRPALDFAGGVPQPGLCIPHSQKTVNGQVRIKLYQGNVTIEGRSSDEMLCDEKFSSIDELGGFEPEATFGFITVQAIRLKHHGLGQQAKGTAGVTADKAYQF